MRTPPRWDKNVGLVQLVKALACGIDRVIMSTIREVLQLILVNLIPDGPKHEDAAVRDRRYIGLGADPLVLTTCRFDRY